MFAIVETGGKQYRVTPNEKFIVEKINGEAGSKITLDKVLLIKPESGELTVGSPLITGASVEVEILKTFRDDKVLIFKKKKKTKLSQKARSSSKSNIIKSFSN